MLEVNFKGSPRMMAGLVIINCGGMGHYQLLEASFERVHHASACGNQ